MPTEKQLLRDKEYYGEYKIGGRYSVEQWEKILSTPVLVDSTDLSILKEIFSSANHAAPITQLCFHHNKEENYYLNRMNSLGEKLGRPNGFLEEIDLQGNPYWWYLIFWGRMTKEGTLEWKLQPALAEALEYLYPELEQNYTAYMSHIDYCLQTRIEQSDAVFLASAVLLFEKYYLENPSNIDDLLLMQYEIQQRAQKIYGQDVSVSVITDICNADSDRCQYHYLRDIYKYWRISYPNEFENDKERPQTLDPTYCIMSYFGYLTVQDLYHFIETDYAKLADPNFIEVNTSDALYKMITFLKNNGSNGYMNLQAPTEEQVEQFLSIKSDAKNAISHFHSIGDILIEQYPNFSQTEKATWLMADKTTIQNSWKDCFQILEYAQNGPSIYTLLNCLEENSRKVTFSICLTIPFTSSTMREEILQICNPLTALTSANFRLVDTEELEIAKPKNFGTSLTAYVSYTETEMLEAGEEKFMPQFETVLQILASYYMNLCQQIFKSLEVAPKTADSDYSNPPDNTTTQTAIENTSNPQTPSKDIEYSNDSQQEIETFDEEFLSDIVIEEIEIEKLLTKINDRIAYFLSRSFQIETKLFYKLKKSPTLNTLGTIFYHDIIPLLENWFEKDYEKIRLVLGDFQKSSKDYEFIPKEILDPAILFGQIAIETNLLPKESYFAQKKAFYQKESYLEL
ncbi:MAG: hypothetical protein ACI4F9_02155 [Lachnospiraceae bacterium]